MSKKDTPNKIEKNFYILSFNYKHLPLEEREAFIKKGYKNIIERYRIEEKILGYVAVETCLRIELYIEIGEDPIDTVIREVKEEVGLNIKNIRPYKTQPWGFSNALMLAFSADLEGDDTIRIQESELKEARWFKREDVPVLENHISVGQEMIEKFKRGLL